MKYLSLLLLLSVLFIFNTNASTTDTSKAVPDTIMALTEDISPAINNAIKNGNAGNLSAYFNTTIQVSVPGKKGTFGKSQAEFIIKDFFTKYPPSSFTINNQGNSSSTSSYYIGTYVSGKKSFRTYYTIKKISGKEVIHVLKFE
jgi:Domain of unknown function (DUF4783)